MYLSDNSNIWITFGFKYVWVISWTLWMLCYTNSSLLHSLNKCSFIPPVQTLTSLQWQQLKLLCRCFNLICKLFSMHAQCLADISQRSGQYLHIENKTPLLSLDLSFILAAMATLGSVLWLSNWKRSCFLLFVCLFLLIGAAGNSLHTVSMAQSL